MLLLLSSAPRLSQFSVFLSRREEAKALIPNICSLAYLAEIEEPRIGKIANRTRSMPHHPHLELDTVGKQEVPN